MAFHCSVCGAQLPVNAVFCRACGARIDATAVEKEAQVQFKKEQDRIQHELTSLYNIKNDAAAQLSKEESSYHTWSVVVWTFALIALIVFCIFIAKLSKEFTPGYMGTAVISFGVFLGCVLGFVIGRSKRINAIRRLEQTVESRSEEIRQLKRSLQSK